MFCLFPSLYQTLIVRLLDRTLLHRLLVYGTM